MAGHCLARCTWPEGSEPACARQYFLKIEHTVNVCAMIMRRDVRTMTTGWVS